MHHMDANKTPTEKVWWELHKKATSYFKQILEATLPQNNSFTTTPPPPPPPSKKSFKLDEQDMRDPVGEARMNW